MNQKPFVQFVVAIGLAGLGLLIAWGMLGVRLTQAQGPDDWEKAKLYGAQVEFNNLTMANDGSLYLCLHDLGYGVYKLAPGVPMWQVFTSTGDGCRSLALDNTNNKLYRFTSKTPPLLRSDDDGLSWTAIYTPTASNGLIAINPVTPTILYMTLRNNNRQTIHYSLNSGVNWSQAQLTLDGGATFTGSIEASIVQIAIDPGHPQYIYFRARTDGTDSGIYMSANGGISYTRVVTHEPWAIGVNLSGTVFATYDYKFWRSFDHGQTWDELDIEAACDGNSPFDISFHPALSGTLFAANAQRVCRSDDEGDNWTPLDLYRVPLIDPSDPISWYVGDRPGVWKSTDEGTSWFEVNEGLSEVSVRRIAASPSNPDHYWVLAGNGGGFTRDGGQTWKFPLRLYEDIDITGIDPYILTSNGGQVIFDPIDHNKVYLTQNTRFYIFENWEVTPGWEITPTHTVDVNAAKPDFSAQDLVFDSTNPLTGYLAAGNDHEDYANDGDGVYKTTNGGLDWYTTSLTLPIRSLLLVTHTNGVTLYAGAIKQDADPGGIFRSVDHGSTWVSLGLEHASITDIAIDPENPLHLYAGTHDRNKTPGQDSFLYQSEDGGLTWALADFGANEPACGDNIAQIAIDPRSSADVYIVLAGNGNICHSPNRGATWEAIYIKALEWGKGNACAINIYRLPESAASPLAGSSIQAQDTSTQSLLYMGATSGVYRRILTDEESIYLPIILKAAS